MTPSAQMHYIGDGLIRLTPTEVNSADRLRVLRQQSIEVIEQRLANFGVAAAGVQHDGIIRKPILGGSGQISGNFTLEDANTIAMLLRSGTLPGWRRPTYIGTWPRSWSACRNRRK